MTDFTYPSTEKHIAALSQKIERYGKKNDQLFFLMVAIFLLGIPYINSRVPWTSEASTLLIKIVLGGAFSYFLGMALYYLYKLAKVNAIRDHFVEQTHIKICVPNIYEGMQQLNAASTNFSQKEMALVTHLTNTLNSTWEKHTEALADKMEGALEDSKIPNFKARHMLREFYTCQEERQAFYEAANTFAKTVNQIRRNNGRAPIFQLTA